MPNSSGDQLGSLTDQYGLLPNPLDRSPISIHTANSVTIPVDLYYYIPIHVVFALNNFPDGVFVGPTNLLLQHNTPLTHCPQQLLFPSQRRSSASILPTAERRVGGGSFVAEEPRNQRQPEEETRHCSSQLSSGTGQSPSED